MNPIDELLNQINDKHFMDISSWPKFNLADIEIINLKLDKKRNGLYAISSKEGDCLYIGKGKSIYGRLKSHYKATKGHNKSGAWNQFFKHYNKDLIAFWHEVDDHASKDIGEEYRKIIELILQMKYEPIFDQVYITKGKKNVRNLKALLQKIKSRKIFLPPNQRLKLTG
jgi:hypothetical protein